MYQKARAFTTSQVSNSVSSKWLFFCAHLHMNYTTSLSVKNDTENPNFDTE